MYLAVQLGHLGGQTDVRAVDQRTSTAGLLTGLLTVADLMETRPKQELVEHIQTKAVVLTVYDQR